MPIDTNGTPHDTYEIVEFTSEAESESDTESGRGEDASPTTKSLASRFERKIQQSKENSPTVGKLLAVSPDGRCSTYTT